MQPSGLVHVDAAKLDGRWATANFSKKCFLNIAHPYTDVSSTCFWYHECVKVASNSKYGPPSLIKIIGMETPIPKPKQVLVKIHYSSVNRTDDGFLLGKPFVTRFFTGLLCPKYISVGCEFSGIVESVGSEV